MRTHYHSIVHDLTSLISRLEGAIADRRGTYLKPAQNILAYAHEMLGKIAFDKLDYTTASGHFHEMMEIGEEARDADLIALSLIHMGDVQRRRGRYEQAVQALDAAQVYSAASTYIGGLRWMILARTNAEYGRKDPFLRAIDMAQAAVTSIEPSLDGANNQFNVVGVLQERAQGHTLLGEPQQALDIYRESNRIQPFRPMRDLGVFAIMQAQAHAYAGNSDTGVEFAVQGLRLARGYQSQRHISRVQRMYDRLQVTTKANHPRARELRDALKA